MSISRVTSIDDPALAALCEFLRERADGLDQSGDWPSEQLAACAAAGVYEWFTPREAGGQGWSEIDAVRAYIRLSAACLTTTFCVTQPVGHCGGWQCAKMSGSSEIGWAISWRDGGS